MSVPATGTGANPASTFEDRWVIVSGASSGIGRAISIDLVARGARVVLMGRNAGRLAETARLAGPADRTLACQLDLVELAAIGPTVKDLVGKTGRLYGLCHAAGVSLTLPLSASRPDRVQPVMSVNFLAGLELARALVDRSVLSEQARLVRSPTAPARARSAPRCVPWRWSWRPGECASMPFRPAWSGRT
jgi:NAD(P)-dependent dehydrogenase (short-subunit alcohol dehydrogenase family)